MVMEEKPWQILVVDDEEEELRKVKELLSMQEYDGYRCTCIPCQDFDGALRFLAEHYVDLVVLDIRQGDLATDVLEDQEAGIRAYNQIRERQFVPVIFRSNVSHHAPPERRPWLSVIDKAGGIDVLDECIREVVGSELPLLQRRFEDHVRGVVRDTLWSWMESQEESVPGLGAEKSDLAYYLMRRLARTLEREMLGEFLRCFGGEWDPDRIVPMGYYLKPPVREGRPMAGDIYAHAGEDGDTSYFVLVTPTCDITYDNADNYVFLRTMEIFRHPSVQAIVRLGRMPGRNNDSHNTLLDLIRNHPKQHRYYFLPAAFGIPPLLVDMQQVLCVPKEQVNADVGDWNRLASLDSPFAQDLVSRFITYFARIGTPDLDYESLVLAIEEQALGKHQAASTGG